MMDHQVVIVGGGPTGLMLAGELALAGADVGILERRTGGDLEGTRAGGLNARSLELLEQRGIAGRFLAEGRTAPQAGFAWMPLDIADLPTRHPCTLALAQRHVERILAGWVAEFGVPVHRGVAVTGLAEEADGVSLALAGGGTVRADYVAGCDGGRSVVRKSAGIGFPGTGASISNLIAEAAFAEEPEWGLRRHERGAFGIGRMEDGRARIMVTEPEGPRAGEPGPADLRAGLAAGYGTDFGVHGITALTRFTDMARQAERFAKGRVLVAGDAAHVHYPAGGQGLNLGLADAVNLGWKLAQVVSGASPPELLESYHAERHPAAARVLDNTLAQVALLRGFDARVKALAGTMAALLAMDEPRRHIAGMMTGLDVRYDLGEGHPLLGRRMPDLDLAAGEGTVRMSALLHAGRPVLVNLGPPGAIGIAGWADRVQLVEARHDGAFALPGAGAVAAPGAVLVRPDGHAAWVGEAGSDAGLAEALQRWFGAPRPGASR
jgi:3-(3-hydroxy-phenyl)propionate hydroxylase